MQTIGRKFSSDQVPPSSGVIDTQKVYKVKGAEPNAFYFDQALKKYYTNVGLTDPADDATADIQATINACESGEGGTVLLSKGPWLVEGPLLTDVNGANPNCQIYIPPRLTTDGYYTNIDIVGEGSGSFAGNSGLGSRPQSKDGTRIITNTTGTGKMPAVLGTKNITALYGPFNYHTVRFRDFRIVSTASTANSVTMGGINMSYASNATVERVQVLPSISAYNSATPYAQSFGIAMPVSNANTVSRVADSLVVGMHHGIVMGEHTVIDNGQAFCCINGFTTTLNGHASTILRGLVQWCKYAMNSAASSGLGLQQGISYLNVWQLDIEWKTQGKWFDNVNIINDPDNHLNGELFYRINLGSGSTTAATFNKVGGKWFECNPINFRNSMLFKDQVTGNLHRVTLENGVWTVGAAVV